MELLDKKWYVVRAVGGQEKKIKTYIESEIKRLNFSNHFSQVLVPTEKVFQIRKGKKVSKERNYFPGYILVEALLEGEMLHAIRNVPGVMGFLTEKNGQPIPIRKVEVNRILGKVDELSELDEQINIPFIIGENVKVIDGPFNGFDAVIEEINEEKRKIKLMVKIFGRKTPLELSFMQIEKV